MEKTFALMFFCLNKKMCQSSIKYRGLIRGDLTEPFRKGLAYSVYQQRFFHDFKGLIRLLFCHILAYLEVRK